MRHVVLRVQQPKEPTGILGSISVQRKMSVVKLWTISSTKVVMIIGRVIVVMDLRAGIWQQTTLIMKPNKNVVKSPATGQRVVVQNPVLTLMMTNGRKTVVVCQHSIQATQSTENIVVMTKIFQTTRQAVRIRIIQETVIMLIIQIVRMPQM